MLAEVPLHPSYEDRPGAPDRVFAALGDDVFEHHVHAWARALAGADEMDVLHLHHLTPINAAAERVAPDVPVVGHLHGTELLMLEAIEADPGRWAHGPAWAERMRGWAGRCERLIVLSDNQVARAEQLLGIDPARCVRVANGFDPETFRPRHVDHRALLAARAGRGAARLGARARRPARCATRRRTWPRSATTAARRRCCSTSAATPRSSGCRC